ncbi:MAG: hypothetical protein LBK83_14295 [Treponema sp.]|jgi:hypothetical protein|nr:hypothetical protein [Treponema sp.]
MATTKHYDFFNPDGIEKAAFFRFEHEDLTPKEIIHLFAEQFGEAVDPEELITGLTVFFNVMPENFDEVFNRRCAEFIAGLNAFRQGKHLIP